MTTPSVGGSAAYAEHRKTRRLKFVQILFGITTVMHLPVVVGVAELARRLGAPQPWLVAIAWGALGLGLFMSRARALMPDRKRSAAVVRLLDIPYFIHWCACLWTLIPSVLVTLVLPVVELVRGVPVALPAGVYMWTYLTGLIVCAYGILVRRRWFRVVEREVRIVDLDPRLSGMKIAQLSDLHIGMYTPKAWGLAWARAANRHQPDLAVVTGDMVTSGTDFHEDIADALGTLKAKLGVFVSMGNHDYFGEGEPLVSLLRSRGLSVLRNEGVVVERGGAKFWLAAIDDTWTGRASLEKTMAARPDGMATVLLAHDPEEFDDAAKLGAELVLSGHTHGGQIAMPFLSRQMSLASLAHPYNVGFYTRGKSTLYVHPGLGTTGPPMRLGAAPEVTILVLKAA